MPAQSLETRLRLAIKAELTAATTPRALPAVWRRIQSPEGYADVEVSVIHLITTQHLTPGAALALLDSEWN